MQEQMRQQTDPLRQSQDQNSQPKHQKPGKTKVGDYIDFEEVKD